jgi:large subunit ribosomal protein L10
LNKNQEAKVAVVEGIKEQFAAAKSVVLIDYRGLTVEEDTEFRRQFREAGVEYRVLKNTMITRAIEGMNLEGMKDYLKGPTAVAFGMTDAVAPAKIAMETIKKTKKMEVKCGVVDGTLIDAAGVQALADLPPREVLLARMLGSMNAPVTGFVTVLSATIKSLLYAINAIVEQKESA